MTRSCSWMVIVFVLCYFMKKQFDQRNEQKKEIDASCHEDSFYVKERQIWNVKLWVNVGCEENGKWWFMRPVLVVKKIWTLYFCIPLTSKIKKETYWYYKISHEVQNWKVSTLLLTQWKVIDKKRFFKHIGYIQKDEFILIKNLLQKLYL